MELLPCGWCGNLPRRRRRRRRRRSAGKGRGSGSERDADAEEEEQYSAPNWNLFIRLKTLRAATDGFSDDNRLGRGGFGPVFKGVMPNGQRIAVKKLSLNSRQGGKEFTNEVTLLLKIQHRNLVSLLGCCAEAGEKMLVYEYLSFGSLDRVLFDKSRSILLDWPKRFEIIKGIARGLLYLHEESPVKIIHRDIKASNILLDEQLNPKISDFGLARLFEGDNTHINTFKISGTFGYMSPEYALNGYLSVKTDVFSYGVLVLEIVSGRKNLDSQLDEEKVDLLNYAWKKSEEEERSLEVMDPTLTAFDGDEATSCIRLALLCCQASVTDRPDMYAVHLMLSGDSFTLPKPGRPGIRGRMGVRTTTAGTSLSGRSAAKCPDDTTSAAGTGSKTSATLVTTEESRNSISVSFTSEGR